MTMHWDSAKDLQLMKLILERENSLRGDSALDNLKGQLRLEPHPHRKHLNELSVKLKLGRKIEVDLYGVISRSDPSLDEIAQSTSELLDGIDDIDRISDMLVEEITELRQHLRKKLAAERRKGARIDASIGIGRVEVDYARDTGPVLALEYVREDLRVHRTEFMVQSTTEIDEAFEDIREELLWHSAQLTELESIGAVGQVHPLLVHAIRQRDLPLEATLRSIYQNDDQSQSIHLENDANIVVYWKAGALTGTFRVGDDVRFQECRIRLGAGRKSVPAPATGREIAEVVNLADPLPQGVRIKAVRKGYDEGQELVVEATPIPFDAQGKLIT